MRFRCPPVLIPLSLLFVLPSAVVAQDWPVPRGPSHEPAPYRYNPKHLQQAPKSFLDDASACIVYYGVTHLVQPDGTTESIVHEVTRMNGRRGIDNLGEYRGITFDPAYQKLTLNVARVIKADGTFVEIQPQHLKLRDTSVADQTYDTEKELIISFPALEVGDLYEVKWTVSGRHPENHGHFFRQYLFGSTNYPFVKESFSVRLPASKTLKFATVNCVIKPEITTRGKYRTCSFEATDNPPLPNDVDRPSNELLRLQLMCSTFPSWDAVGDWKRKIRKDCWECTPQIKEIVRQVTAGLKTPQQKARALTYWVRKKIRYVSVLSSTHRYTPAKPAAVISNRFGDCKDQAQLLAVMLREIGLEVHLVTLGMRGDGQVVPEVPSPWGTHAILLVRIDGKDHWIDTTNSLAGWDFLPRSDRDRVCYVTDEHGKLKLMRTPKAGAGDNSFDQTTWVTVQPDGTTVCKRQAEYHGFAAMTQRDQWLDAPDGESRRSTAADLQSAHSRSQLLDLHLNPVNLHQRSEPVRATIEFQIPQHFSGKKLLEASFSDSHVWDRLLAYTAARDRRTDLDLQTPFESVDRYNIQLPPHYCFSTNSWNVTALSKWGSFLVQVKRDPKDPRRLELLFHTRLEDPQVKVADFAEFRQFRQRVYDHWRVWLSIEPTIEYDDATVLESLHYWLPHDLHTTKILAQLYLHHQSPADARRVLQRSLIYHPDNQALWELAVRATRTWREEEQTYRFMVKRFPHELKYVLALAKSCIAQDKHTEAEEFLKTLTESSSDEMRGQAYYQLARSAAQRASPKQALTYLKLATIADPHVLDAAAALQLAGHVYEQLKQPEKAIKVYRRALQVQPGAQQILASLIRLELSANRPNHALRWLRQYSVAAKGDVEGLNQAAAFHLHLGRLDDAYDLAMQARDITFHADTQKLLGLVSFRWGDYEKAIFHLKRATINSEVMVPLLNACLGLGDISKAKRYVTVAERLDSTSKQLSSLVDKITDLTKRKTVLLADLNISSDREQAWSAAAEKFVCAEYAYQAGKSTACVTALLDQAFLTDIEFGAAYALRALLHLENGRFRFAVQDAEKAILLSPKEPRGWYVRGRIRYETFQKDALQDLQRAAALSKRQDAQILHWLAAAQFDAGMRREALATQKEAIVLLPGDEELLAQLKRFHEN